MTWVPLHLTSDPHELEYRADPADLVGASSVLLELLNRPAWMADASCREHPDVNFFPERGEDVRAAKAVCSGCLVAEDCFAYAVGRGVYLSGIWAGTSDRQRRRARRDAA